MKDNYTTNYHYLPYTFLLKRLGGCTLILNLEVKGFMLNAPALIWILIGCHWIWDWLRPPCKAAFCHMDSVTCHAGWFELFHWALSWSWGSTKQNPQLCCGSCTMAANDQTPNPWTTKYHSVRASFWGDAYTVRKWTRNLRTKIRKCVPIK